MVKDTLLDKINSTDFEQLFKKLDYSFFTKGCYNLNIIGIRRYNKKVSNAFDDYLVVLYKTPKREWSRFIFPITTEPGLYYMKNPANKAGTAILVPRQYKQCWSIGKHKGKYEALVQIAPVSVYRDGNKNTVYDCDSEKTDTGVFGINIHKAGESSKLVDKWSAGCQVFKISNDFRAFMRLCHKQVESGYGNKFTYTLLDEKQL